MPLKTHLDDEPTLNLTAMLDVMFLLIIFFMLGTKFREEEEHDISVRVPAVAGTATGPMTAAPARRIVNVDQYGNVTLDQAPVSVEELAYRLAAARQQYAGLRVLVRGDARGQFQGVASALNACKQAGIQDLAITVRLVPPESSGM